MTTINSESPQFAGPCVRCNGGVPNDAHAGAYPGALSRYDNKTYICSDCGTAEAMFNYAHPGSPLPGFDELIPVRSKELNDAEDEATLARAERAEL